VRAARPPPAPPPRQSSQGRPKRRKRGANAAKASDNLLAEQIWFFRNLCGAGGQIGAQ
jgi:hypothetical protein